MVFLQMPRDGSCAAADFIGSRAGITDEAITPRADVLVDMGGLGPWLLCGCS